MSAEEDDELMSRLQHGEDRALDALMDRWQVPLRRFLYRSTQNEHDAWDLAQETFVGVYRHKEKFRRGATFSTWLFSIALNLCRDRARRGKLRRAQPLEESLESDLRSREPSPDFSATQREMAEAVRGAVADLPEQLRSAVLLCEYEDLSQNEAAAVIGCSAKAVETRLYRARALLRRALEKYL